MKSRSETIAIVCGMIAAAGSAAVIVMGHRPWYAWTTLAVGLATVWTMRGVWRAERGQVAGTVPPANPRSRGS